MSNRICAIDIDERGLARPTPEIEQERRVAIFDLLEENRFGLPAREGREVPPGPYRLGLAIREGRLVYAHPALITAGRGNFLRCARASMQRPAVARFVDHLFNALKS